MAGELINAPSGKPAPNAFPVNKISGTTPYCSKANKVPVLPKPDCISSKINKAHSSSHFALSAFNQSIEAGVTPDSACTGSTMTPATLWSIIAISSILFYRK